MERLTPVNKRPVQRRTNREMVSARLTPEQIQTLNQIHPSITLALITLIDDYANRLSSGSCGPLKACQEPSTRGGNRRRAKLQQPRLSDDRPNLSTDAAH